MGISEYSLRKGRSIATIRQYVLNSLAEQEASQAQPDPSIQNPPPNVITGTPLNLIDIGAAELFEELNISQLCMVGQASTAYEAHEYNIDISATLGSSLELFGTEIGLEASVSVGGTITTYKLILVQKLPNLVRKEFIFRDGRQINKSYEVAKPIFLSRLKGISKSIRISASAFAGVSSEGEIPIGPISNLANSLSNDRLAIADTLSYSIELAAEASIGYEGTYMSLVDECPSWYPSTADKNFLLEMEANAGASRRKILLREIYNWIYKTYNPFKTNPVVANILLYAKESCNFFKPNFSTNCIVKALDSAYQYENSIQGAQGSKSENQLKLSHYRFLAGIVISESFYTKNNDGQIKIETKLQNLGFTLNRSGLKELGTFNSYQNQIDVYTRYMKNSNTYFSLVFNQNMMKVYRVSEGNSTLVNSVRILPKPIFLSQDASLNLPENLFTKLVYWGHKGSASASARATLQGIGAGANIEGCAKKAKYRIQNYVPFSDGDNLLFTQDVEVVYKQLDMAAGLVKGDSIKGAEKNYNSVSYKASVCIWLPNLNSRIGFGLNSFALEGSGLMFGNSISLSSLNKWGTLLDNNVLKQRTALALHVTVTELNNFITALKQKFGPVLTEQSIGAPIVILESALAADEAPFNYSINSNKEPTLSKTTLSEWLQHLNLNYNQLRNPPQIRPGYGQFGYYQAPPANPPIQIFRNRFLRVRVRKSEMIEKKGFTFKLGFELGMGSVGIELSDITKAGNEGVIDVFTFDLTANSEYIEPAGGTSTGKKSSMYDPTSGTSIEVPYVWPTTLIFQ